MSAAELSSVATVLEDLTARITGIAEGYAAERRDDLAAELYEVERALLGVRRRLARVVEGSAGRA